MKKKFLLLLPLLLLTGCGLENVIEEKNGTIVGKYTQPVPHIFTIIINNSPTNVFYYTTAYYFKIENYGEINVPSNDYYEYKIGDIYTWETQHLEWR